MSPAVAGADELRTGAPFGRRSYCRALQDATTYGRMDMLCCALAIFPTQHRLMLEFLMEHRR